MKYFLPFLILSILAFEASAHGGGLDSCGGHNDRKNGGYHVHRQEAYNACYAPQKEKQEEAAAIVKKSNSGICHAPGTTYYNRTYTFTAFDTLEACLNSGGRLPQR